MTMNTLHLLPVGYLIVEEVEHQPQAPRPKYYGVDRLPPLIAPQREIREYFGEPPVEDKQLYQALDEWFDTLAGPVAFIPSAKKAFDLFDAFVSYGHGLELLFCHMAWQPGEEDRVGAYRSLDQGPPAFAATYGFDVS